MREYSTSVRPHNGHMRRSDRYDQHTQIVKHQSNRLMRRNERKIIDEELAQA